MKTIISTFLTALLVIGIAWVNFTAEVTYAYCPQGNDCENKLVKFERHSKAWWTEYCNTLGC